jgi:hypothetical protein
MSEWLDLMLQEIQRKKQESKEAEEEAARRASGKDRSRQQKPNTDSD